MCVGFLLGSCSLRVGAAVVVALLRGPLFRQVVVATAGLQAIGNLAVRDDNRKLLVAAGACDGE